MEAFDALKARSRGDALEAFGEKEPERSKPRLNVKPPAPVEAGLDSRDGVIARLKQICDDKGEKTDVVLKALRQICEIRGFASVPELGEYRTMSNEALLTLFFDVVLVALREFGVRDSALLHVLCPKCKAVLEAEYAINLEAAASPG